MKVSKTEFELTKMKKWNFPRKTASFEIKKPLIYEEKLSNIKSWTSSWGVVGQKPQELIS